MTQGNDGARGPPPRGSVYRRAPPANVSIAQNRWTATGREPPVGRDQNEAPFDQQWSDAWIPPRRPKDALPRGTRASCSARSRPSRKAAVLDIIDFGPSSHIRHLGLDDPTMEELSTQMGRISGTGRASFPEATPEPCLTARPIKSSPLRRYLLLYRQRCLLG